MSFEQFRRVLENPVQQLLADYWHELRGTRRMPAWKEIDPTRIVRCLPHIWAWRYDAASGRFTGILAGEELLATGERNMRGRSLEEYSGHGTAAQIRERFLQALAGPYLMHAIGTIYSASGHGGKGEWIILPMASGGERPDVLMGATTYTVVPMHPDIGERRAWREGERVSTFEL